MKNLLKQYSWSPYTIGASIGILAWITYYFMNELFSVSSSFVRLSGFLLSFFSTVHVKASPYYAKFFNDQPVFNWHFAFGVCIFVGSLISAKLSKASFSFIPSLWAKNFGYSYKARALGAFIGGFFLLFGARLAGGCTSGHGISGGLQLATLSWIFLPSLFIGGIGTAFFLYRKK